MSGDARRIYSQQELANKAKQFMTDQYGPVDAIDLHDDKDAWHERYGLLIAFIDSLYPDNPF